jgi:hypothetical protein
MMLFFYIASGDVQDGFNGLHGQAFSFPTFFAFWKTLDAAQRDG